MAEKGRELPEKRELTAKQQAFMTALLTPLGVGAAAKATGIGARTASGWMSQPHFQAEYKRAQDRQFDEALRALRQGVSTAIRTLLRDMTSDSTAPYVQVQAAVAWLDRSLDIHKMAELEQKIAELETLIKDSGVLKR